MNARKWFGCVLVTGLAAFSLHVPIATACCPVSRPGSPVVNSDQAVIVLWDPATKTEHFIRQASFKSAADDFGFLIPTPNKPELSESGGGAFAYLQKLTAAKITKKTPAANGFPGGFGAFEPVKVLEEKRVAGFDAVVLEASSAEALVGWLKVHGYVLSPEVQTWVKPYVDAGWKITALKVAKQADGANPTGKQPEGKVVRGKAAGRAVDAPALRMSFTTDYPLFPYREPESKAAAQTLGAKQRLLRIYFLSDERYEGKLGKEAAWTGQAVWSHKITATDRGRILAMLKLPKTTGPHDMWLTEFEDNWAYQAAPADLVFSPSQDQTTITRPEVSE